MKMVSQMTARIKDQNGWYEVKNNPISKVGVFPYLGKSIDFDGSMKLDPDKMYNVFRPESELSDPECMASFRLVPLVNDHEMIGEDMTPAEHKGVEGVVGEDVYFDKADGMLKANIKIFSENLKKHIDLGKNELSCGYSCNYDLKTGIFDGVRYDVVQGNIRGNHLALVDEGRMGPEVSVLDRSEQLSFAVDSKDIEEITMPENMVKEDEKKAVDEMTLAEVTETLKTIMPQIESLMSAMQGKEEEVEVVGDEEEKEEDTKDACEQEDSAVDSKEYKAAEAKLKELQKTVDSMEKEFSNYKKDGIKSLTKLISKRDSLANKLSYHVGAFDHKEMTLEEVAEYGVKKLEIPCGDDKVGAVEAYLHGRQPQTPTFSQDSSQSQGFSSLDKYMKGDK